MEDKLKLDLKKVSRGERLREFAVKNMVTLFFVVLCTVGFAFSGMTFGFLLNEIVVRLVRNSFLVLALLLPVMAGMGLNFAIVLGAMCTQAAVILVTHWGVVGMGGIVLAVILTTPLSIMLGYLTGKLFNRTKGQEMMAGLILGFFASGVYQFIFLILVGSVIPFENETLVLSSGVGLRTTIDLKDGLRYAVDDVWTMPLTSFAIYLGIAIVAYGLYRYLRGIPTLAVAPRNKKYFLPAGLGAVLMAWGFYIRNSVTFINFISVPMLTVGLIALLCIFTSFFARTKLGQDFRTVGQDRHIANVSGIHSDRTRLIAMVLSTVLAGWGHLIFLQNLGTFSTYGSHEQIGFYSVAALLIGGASVTNAKISHALLGTFLFHTLFIVSPLAGKEIFGDAQLGEYFRVFVAYGVIGVSLVMHAWKKHIQGRQSLISGR